MVDVSIPKVKEQQICNIVFHWGIDWKFVG